VNESLLPLDSLVFGTLPYVAIVLFAAGTIARLLRDPASLTSRSSQFLENRGHFWAMVPFHYGILVVLAGHLLAFIMPNAILGWNASLTRLYVLETTGLACGLLAALGLSLAILRRSSVPAVRITTTMPDWIVLFVLLVQTVSGVAVAIAYSWGSSWFAGVATPYIWSIVRLQPDVAAIAAMPLVIKTHVAGAWLLIAIFPFSRLVHVLNVPAPYLWRRPQVVRWYRPRPAPLER
jgi:nitrate reductase gamma subunit